MNPAPLVSIVIANYNYGRFLGEAIQSALDQSHPEVEVILVDDGSSDDSLEVAARYPIQVHALVNGGVSAARNFGASRSRGAFLLFLDADDRLEPQAVAVMVAALAAAPERVAYAYPQYRRFGDQDGVYESKPFSHRALVAGTFVPATSLIRREVFEAVGGWDPNWNVALEDYELWLRLLHHGYHGVLVPEPLLLYRHHGPSRNEAAVSQRQALKWRMIMTYPGLFWRKVLKHPVRSLYLYFKLGEARKRRGPTVRLRPGP